MITNKPITIVVTITITVITLIIIISLFIPPLEEECPTTNRIHLQGYVQMYDGRECTMANSDPPLQQQPPPSMGWPRRTRCSRPA